MSAQTGKIHSFQTFGTLDGPGIRFVLFMQGCPLRCPYCHNPDTWDIAGGKSYTVDEVVTMVLRYKDYYGVNGGITVSGGEALLQADFVCELFTELKKHGIHTALDTSGCIMNCKVKSLLDVTDLVLLDIKMNTDRDYKSYIGTSINEVTLFLDELCRRNTSTWIRQVIVKGFNDSDEHAAELKELIKPYGCITKLELLPFRKLCREKYKEMGIPFPFDKYPESDPDEVRRLERIAGEDVNCG